MTAGNLHIGDQHRVQVWSPHNCFLKLRVESLKVFVENIEKFVQQVPVKLFLKLVLDFHYNPDKKITNSRIVNHFPVVIYHFFQVTNSKSSKIRINNMQFRKPTQSPLYSILMLITKLLTSKFLYINLYLQNYIYINH